MNTSPAAWATAAPGPTASVIASATSHRLRSVMISSSSRVRDDTIRGGTVPFPARPAAPSVRERPPPQLLLRELPQPRQPARLDGQEEQDEAAEHHQLDLLLEGDRQAEAEPARHVGEQDRHQHDERRPQERAQHGTEPPDDDHEED